ncbi:TonB-dependent receptor plug domain-containing protein [Candidatus Nitrospira bockiana]
MAEELRFLAEETVVSAIRHEQPISQAPSNVYVITDEDIRNSGATDIPTILRRIPGMEVMQMTGADFNVGIRGDNQLLANKLLVLVDGRSVYIDAQSFVFWKGLPVTLPEIKRIEVVKGPAAAIYGFNAFDGVVNIITKPPEEMNGSTVQVGGGELGTLTTAGIQAGRTGRLGYRLSIGEDQNQQWRHRDALAFRAYRVNGHTEYDLSGDARVVVSAGLVDMNRFDGPIQRAISLSSDVRLPYANIAYERPNAFVRAWWNQFDASSLTVTDPRLAGLLTTTDPTGDRILTFLGNTYNLEGQQTLAITASHRVIYGANYRRNTFSGDAVTGSQGENRLGLYVQDEWRATETVTVVAGVRWDLDTFIHQTFSPRGTLLYTPVPGHTFRLSVSVAYRPPTLFETYERLRTTVPPLGATIAIQGSRNLEPEEIVSYQAGYQGWFLKHRLRLRADLFFNHISQLIDLHPVAPSLLKNVNGGSADIYGGEAGVEVLITDWLRGFANYAYQELGQTLTGLARRGAPTHKLNAGLHGEWDNGLSAQALVHYYGVATYPLIDFFPQFAAAGLIPTSSVPDPRVGSYTLLNLRAGYWLWRDKAELAVSVFNALNDRHREHPLGDVIGSRVMGWLTIKL